MQVILPQFTSLALQWSLATANAAMALKSFVSALILLALPAIRSRFLEPRLSTARIDLLITEASVAANFVGMIGLSFSYTPFVYIPSLCIYTTGHGLADSLTAYGTMTLPPGVSLGDFYVRSGLSQSLAGLAAAFTWSGLLGIVLTERTFSLGMPLRVCAGIFGLAWIGARALQRWHINP